MCVYIYDMRVYDICIFEYICIYICIYVYVYMLCKYTYVYSHIHISNIHIYQ